MTTHEEFVHSVRNIALQLSPIEPAIKERLAAIKLVYGVGQSGVRGVTYYNAWQSANTSEVIEICACSEENWIQLAGTTIHELAPRNSRSLDMRSYWLTDYASRYDVGCDGISLIADVYYWVGNRRYTLRMLSADQVVWC